MLDLFKRIFGSSSVINKAADGIYNGVDKAVYTEEEKSKGFLNLLKAYEPFKLAQRLLALFIMIPYVLVAFICGVTIIASGFVDPSMGKSIDEASRTALELTNDQLKDLAILVAAFYFGGGAMEGVVDRIKGDRKDG